MNVLFFAQSRSLDVFYELYLRVKKRLGLERIGFYIANLRHYESFLQEHPDFEKELVVLKEWEIHQEAASHTPDLERIASYEKEIGDPTLWAAIVADRRLYMGKRATFRQDYRPRFSSKRLLAILDVALRQIDGLFQAIQPDLVCTIYTATFGDCLGHLFAQARNIQSLDLRLARLKNYVMFVDGVTEPPPHIRAIMEEFRAGVPPDLESEAEEYVRSVVSGNAMYEGVVPAEARKCQAREEPKDLTVLGSKSGAYKYIDFLIQYLQSGRPPYCYDYQIPDMVQAYFYAKFLNPWNRRRTVRALEREVARKEELEKLNYVLYPLHTEPELVLAQFARPYLNQIEVVRNIRLSMPVEMTLLVKEHPMMLGRRSLGYYRKLLEIPNVKLVQFDLPSEAALQHARLVVIIRGAIGLEAVIRRKPVVSLGKSMFDLLPASMFLPCRNLYEFPAAIGRMLEAYQYDHQGLIRYLAAVRRGSVRVNLVSDLLGKKGRFRSGEACEMKAFGEHPHLDLLADYLVERVNASGSQAPHGRVR